MTGMNEIRHHIKAVEQTRKITGAMHLIASARIQRIMPQMDYNSRYLLRLLDSMRHILASSDDFDHPYLHDRGDKRRLFIVMAGDKGMVGSFNSDILKFALEKVLAAPERYLITVGIEAVRFFQKHGIEPDKQVIGASQDPSLFYARHMMQDVFKLYDARQIDSAYMIHMRYYNSVSYAPKMRRLLPVDTTLIDMDNIAQYKDVGMIYHPSPDESFRLLAPQFTLGQIHAALMQSYCSEHCARMNAMQSATKNADEILDRLKSAYNIARQAQITQEITEITSAAMAQTAEEA